MKYSWLSSSSSPSTFTSDLRLFLFSALLSPRTSFSPSASLLFDASLSSGLERFRAQ